MNIRPLHSERDYHEAKQKLAAWFDALPEPDTEQGDLFEVLLILVANYESTHFRLEAPDPIEAIKFRMAREGLDVLIGH